MPLTPSKADVPPVDTLSFSHPSQPQAKSDCPLLSNVETEALKVQFHSSIHASPIANKSQHRCSKSVEHYRRALSDSF